MTTKKKIINTILMVVALLSTAIALMFVAPGGQIIGYGIQYVFLTLALIILLVIWEINSRNKTIKAMSLLAMTGNIVSLVPLIILQDLNFFTHTFGIIMISCSILLCLITIIYFWRGEKRATTY